jgi:hypothetical protein
MVRLVLVQAADSSDGSVLHTNKTARIGFIDESKVPSFFNG